MKARIIISRQEKITCDKFVTGQLYTCVKDNGDNWIGGYYWHEEHLLKGVARGISSLGYFNDLHFNSSRNYLFKPVFDKKEFVVKHKILTFNA